MSTEATEVTIPAVVAADAPAVAEEVSTANPTKKYTPEQTAHISSLIRDAQARAAKDLRRENVELKASIQKFQRQTTGAPEELEALEAKLAVAKGELSDTTRRIESSAIRSSLAAACEQIGFFDSAIAARLLRDNVEVVGGVLTVIDQNGAPRLNAYLKPMTLAELATEYGAAKPFLVRGEVRAGVGSFESQQNTSNREPLEKYFGPNSDSAAANALPRTLYSAMRTRARAKGLIA